jgi:hypothetical protein
VALLTALVAGLIALLLLAPIALVAKILLLLIALILLLSVHFIKYLRELESSLKISLRGCHSVSRFPKVTFPFWMRD